MPDLACQKILPYYYLINNSCRKDLTIFSHDNSGYEIR
jgi:hypothetical protein